jgi:hypothetical protein
MKSLDQAMMAPADASDMSDGSTALDPAPIRTPFEPQSIVPDGETR